MAKDRQNQSTDPLGLAPRMKEIQWLSAKLLLSQRTSFTIRTSRMGSWHRQYSYLAHHLIHHSGKLDGVSCDVCRTTSPLNPSLKFGYWGPIRCVVVSRC
jgi:hypothetical protein